MPFSSKVVAEAITTSLLEENEAAMTRAAPRLTPGNTFKLALESSLYLQIYLVIKLITERARFTCSHLAISSCV